MADLLLRLLGRAADVRGEDDVVEAAQRDSNGSPWALGSIGKTSIAAPAMWPDRIRSRSASVSTTMPREALMNSERGFIRSN